MRAANIQRKTRETETSVELEIDGQGTYDVQTPIGFLTHMLETFARHGLFDLTVRACGDLDVDQHHLLEDCGIVLGQAFKQALGDRSGISRAGYFVYPMDEALAVVAVDLGGRPCLQYETRFQRRFCGGLDTDLLEDFYHGFAMHLGANLVVRMPYGRSDHHRCEAAFKAFARAMKMACSRELREVQGVLSTKGVID